MEDGRPFSKLEPAVLSADRCALLEGRVEDLALEAMPLARALRPLGRRIVVVRAKADDCFGQIVIPDPVRDLHRPRAGWVVVAGALVGSPYHDRFPGGWTGHPEQLVGQRVVFGAGGGSNIVLHERENPKARETNWIVLTDLDIWCIEPDEAI